MLIRLSKIPEGSMTGQKKKPKLIFWQITLPTSLLAKSTTSHFIFFLSIKLYDPPKNGMRFDVASECLDYDTATNLRDVIDSDGILTDQEKKEIIQSLTVNKHLIWE